MNIHKVYNTPTKSDICVVFCYFNAAGYVRSLQNLLFFENKLKQANIPYFSIEMVIGDQEPILANPTLCVRSKSSLFYKEALWNRVEKEIPEQYTKICFLDSDIIFDDPKWVDNLSELLDSYDLVHPFKTINWLDLSFNILLSGVSKFYNSILDIKQACSTPGIGWGISRKFFSEIGGFFDKCILGSGDSMFYSAILTSTMQIPPILKIEYNTYKTNIIKYKPSVTYLDCSIYHLYHGSEKNRKYTSRYSIFNSIKSSFDELVSINSDGFLELNDSKINTKFHQYFLERAEDTVENIINTKPLVYISLTSIYDRQDSLMAVLNNLKLQTYKNIEINLYLSKEPYLLDEGFDKFPISSKLSAFLETHSDLIKVHWVPNTGSFRKLLPLLEETWGQDQLICTVDDDVILDVNTIEQYVNEYLKTGYRICSRGLYISFPDGNQHRNPNYFRGLESRDIMAIGNSAILYNAKWFTDKRIINYSLYKEICPTDDDLWFHCWLVESDHITKCIDMLIHKDKGPPNSLFAKIHSNNRGFKRASESIKLLKTKCSILTDKVSVGPSILTKSNTKINTSKLISYRLYK